MNVDNTLALRPRLVLLEWIVACLCSESWRAAGCVQDFIKHYATLFNEKRAQLEEQQRHISTGLRKLQDTQKDVFTLREGLQKKGLELEGKQKLANDKLEQIMVRALSRSSSRATLAMINSFKVLF